MLLSSDYTSWRRMSKDKKIHSLESARCVDFSFYGSKFLSFGPDKNLLPLPNVDQEKALLDETAFGGQKHISIRSRQSRSGLASIAATLSWIKMLKENSLTWSILHTIS
jgi:hypothetical protein